MSNRCAHPSESVYGMLQQQGDEQGMAYMQHLSAAERQSAEDAYNVFMEEGDHNLVHYMSTLACTQLKELEQNFLTLQLEAKEQGDTLDADQLLVLDTLGYVFMSRAILDQVHISRIPSQERPEAQTSPVAA